MLREVKCKVKGHELSLGFVSTYHKLQGQTVDKIILVLDKQVNAICDVSIESLYVGLSRVRTGNDLRYLPCNSIRHLRLLKRDTCLIKWYNNYDDDGDWIPNGLVSADTIKMRGIKRSLGEMACNVADCKCASFSGKKKFHAKKRSNRVAFRYADGRKMLRELDIPTKDTTGKEVQWAIATKSQVYTALTPVFEAAHKEWVKSVVLVR